MTFQFRQFVPGQKISEPGAYVGVPMEVYHGDPCVGPSVSSSGLRTIFIDSLKHYWNTSVYNVGREEQKATEAMVLGRAAHHLLLGEADFSSLFAIQPDKAPDGRAWNGNNLSCINWLAERALEGLTVLTQKQVEQVKGMMISLGDEPIVQGGILNGDIEISLFWRDAETGIWLKSRPDVIPNDSGDVADLKCVSDVSDDGVARGLAAQGYHQQGALVGEAFRQVLGMEMQHFTLVYVEQKRPHCVRFDEVTPDEIAEGAKENRAALRLLKRAFETNYWPGPRALDGDAGFIRRPSYATYRAQQRLQAIEAELA